MSREWLFIQASDVLMFRDSKPFAAGQNFKAHSMFPPTPRTMQGVIRSHYLDIQGVDWQVYANGNADPNILAAIGGPDDLGTLKLVGPFVAQETDENVGVIRLVRAPLDLLQAKGDATGQKPIILSPEQHPSFKANMPFKDWRALRSANDVGMSDYENVAGWLDDQSFAAYLQGNPPEKIISDKCLFERENRVGIALNRHRTAQESLFYEAEFIRTKVSTGLLVEVNAGLFPDEQGVMAIGGEGRGGHYRKVSYNPNLPPVGNGRIKIVLLTPAYFSGGWKPAEDDWSPWLGQGARLVSVAIGKPLLISGWDLARKESRSLHHYLPAGSVFYFENAHEPQQPFTETPPHSPDAGAMGFGAFAAANWDYR